MMGVREEEGGLIQDTRIIDTSDPADLKTKNYLFVSYLLIAWMITHWI